MNVEFVKAMKNTVDIPSIEWRFYNRRISAIISKDRGFFCHQEEECNGEWMLYHMQTKHAGAWCTENGTPNPLKRWHMYWRQRRLDSSVQGVVGNFYFSVSCLQTSRETHLCVVINMDAIDRQAAESTSFKSSSYFFLHCCDMLNLFTFSVRSRLFLMINGFEKKFLLKDECSFCNWARKLDALKSASVLLKNPVLILSLTLKKATRRASSSETAIAQPHQDPMETLPVTPLLDVDRWMLMQLFVFPRNGWPWNIFWSNIKGWQRGKWGHSWKRKCFIVCHIMDWKTVNSLSLKLKI